MTGACCSSGERLFTQYPSDAVASRKQADRLVLRGWRRNDNQITSPPLDHGCSTIEERRDPPVLAETLKPFGIRVGGCGELHTRNRFRSSGVVAEDGTSASHGPARDQPTTSDANSQRQVNTTLP